MSCLAIIPARGGSKRIPRKNIKDFLGKPIISYSIEAAIKSNLFEEIMVSTEDEEIANIARTYGAQVPFLRSKNNADDNASTFEVLKEVIMVYNEIKKRQFDSICCIYPCAPLIDPKNLNLAFERMRKENLDSVFPVIPFDFPIQKAIILQDSKPSLLFSQHFDARSQDLEKTFHDAGQFYFLKTQKILRNEKGIGNRTGVIKLTLLEAQDIDNEIDWKIAEIKYGIIQNTY